MMLRSRHLISGLVLSAVIAASSLSGPAGAQTAPSDAYRLTFDNYVTTDPLPYGATSDLDVLVHSRDIYTSASLEPMEIQHGPHCEAPPATHHTTGAYDDAVFICAANPHLMTAISASGYGVIYLTPSAMIDMSGGESVLRFDVSTLRTSLRDWWDVWVTPYDDLALAPLEPWLPDLQGYPKRAVNVRMDIANGTQTFFRPLVVRDFAGASPAFDGGSTLESALVPSASRRDTFELRLSKTHMKFSLLSATTGQPLRTWVDAAIADLGWDKGVVQIGHHSYNPNKCDPGVVCGPNTWHWDNVSISPAAPLTVIPSRERFAWSGHDTYVFAEPAPDDAYLLVHMLAEVGEYSVNGGQSWATMTQQASALNDGGHLRTFRQPIPAGTTAVKLRGQNAWAGPWVANHAAIYSAAQRPPQAPTPTGTPLPTATLPPTNTPTPIPDTPTPGPTSTSVSFPTSTSTSQPAATSTATPMPSGDCTVTVVRGGTPEATWGCQ